MLKRLFLISLLLGLFYLSSTSRILVSDPSTWMNGQHRDPTTDISHLLEDNSVFFNTYFEDDTTVDDLSFEFYIRKLFHITAYAVLAVLIFFNLPRMSFRYLSSFLLTIGVSFLDEVNQYLTLGRSGRLWDVYLDSAAAWCALFLLFAIRIFLIFFNKNKKPQKNFSGSHSTEFPLKKHP